MLKYEKKYVSKDVSISVLLSLIPLGDNDGGHGSRNNSKFRSSEDQKGPGSLISYFRIIKNP